MSDEFDREVRTTTTTTDGGVEREVHTTRTVAEPARSGGGGAGLWVVLGLIAIVAIVALVYFTQNKTADEEINITTPAPAAAPTSADATRAIEGASAAVAGAAERTADAVEGAVTTEPAASQ